MATATTAGEGCGKQDHSSKPFTRSLPCVYWGFVDRAVVPPGAPRTLVKGQGVRPSRKIDQDLVVRTLRRIVFGQLAAKPSRLHTDRGVHVGIEIVWPPKDLGRNSILFGGRTGVVQRMIGEVAQQLAQ